jgi:hypothetical protein
MQQSNEKSYTRGHLISYIKKEFLSVFKEGQEVQRLEADGRGIWQGIERRYISLSYFELNHDLLRISEAASFKAQTEEKKDATVDIGGEIGFSGAGHFLVQLFRLPAMSGSEISFAKLMQVAYNAGQLDIVLERGDFGDKTEAVRSFVEKYGLMHFETYLQF